MYTPSFIRSELRSYVNERAAQLVPHSVREAFVEDVSEDLEQMDEGRLAGLGFTPEQL